MIKPATYPLTYFTNKTQDELDIIIEDLHTTLPKEDIANLFIEKFDADKLFEVYHIAVTDKFISAIKSTLKYAIDTEMLIRYIYSKFEENEL